MVGNVLFNGKMAGLLALSLLVTQPALSEDGRIGVSETSGDWSVVCRELKHDAQEKARRSCQMRQDVRRVTFAIPSSTDDNGAEAVIITPFGLRLSQRVVVEIDGVTVMKAPFQTCLPMGCLVQIYLDGDLLKLMSKGKKFTVIIGRLEGDQPLRVEFSLNGFTAARSKLQALALKFSLPARLGANGACDRLFGLHTPLTGSL